MYITFDPYKKDYKLSEDWNSFKKNIPILYYNGGSKLVRSELITITLDELKTLCSLTASQAESVEQYIKTVFSHSNVFFVEQRQPEYNFRRQLTEWFYGIDKKKCYRMVDTFFSPFYTYISAVKVNHSSTIKLRFQCNSCEINADPTKADMQAEFEKTNRKIFIDIALDSIC